MAVKCAAEGCTNDAPVWMCWAHCRGATLSPDRVYRYALWRIWTPHKPLIMFIGLNPSTADAQRDDHTITRCIGFAGRWGFGGLVMCNLFAYRATDPDEMKLAADPIGPGNDAALDQWAGRASEIVAVWGNHGAHLGRDRAVQARYIALRCMGTTKGGAPCHPARLGNDTPLQRYPTPAMMQQSTREEK